MDMGRLGEEAARARRNEEHVQEERRRRTRQGRWWLAGICATIALGYALVGERTPYAEPEDIGIAAPASANAASLKAAAAAPAGVPRETLEVWERSNPDWRGTAGQANAGRWSHAPTPTGAYAARSPAGEVEGGSGTARLWVECKDKARGRVEVRVRRYGGRSPEWRHETRSQVGARWNRVDATEVRYSTRVEGGALVLAHGEPEARTGLLEDLSQGRRLWLALIGRKDETLVWGTTLRGSREAIAAELRECARKTPAQECDEGFRERVAMLNSLDRAMLRHSERAKTLISIGSWESALAETEKACSAARRYVDLGEGTERVLGRRCWDRKNGETGGRAGRELKRALHTARLAAYQC